MQSKTKKVEVNPNLKVVLFLFLLGWVFVYMLFINEASVIGAFFGVIDTLIDSMAEVSIIISVGILIGIIYIISVFFGQINADIYSFAKINQLIETRLVKKEVKSFLRGVMDLSQVKTNRSFLPRTISGLMTNMILFYIIAWFYLIVYTESLYYLAWASGVILPITPNTMFLLPVMALALPFTVRMLTYIEYPHVQAFADFLPMVMFLMLLLLIISQLYVSNFEFYIVEVMKAGLLNQYLRYALYLTFLPIIIESVFWVFAVMVLKKN